MYAGDLRKLKDAFNHWAASHLGLRFSGAGPAPDADTVPPNAVAEALKEVLGLKRLDPKLEQQLKTARLRPSKDGRSLLIDLKYMSGMMRGSFRKSSMAEKPKKNMLLLSGSKATGNMPEGATPGFLEFAEPWIKEFWAPAVKADKPVLFVPYARPSGTTEDAYFKKIEATFAEMGIKTVCAPPEGLTAKDLKNVGGIFIGGGHTYTLLHKLQQNGALDLIRKKVAAGLPYMGSSAGTIIACPTIKTTNDMPCPAHDVIDLKSLGLIGAQLNCHYMDDAMHDPKHQGETRDTRLREFCAFNPGISVLGLYEGTALRIEGDKTQLLTSARCRGTKPPVFTDNKREEIECQIGVPQDVSDIFSVKKSAAPKKSPGPGA